MRVGEKSPTLFYYIYLQTMTKKKHRKLKIGEFYKYTIRDRVSIIQILNKNNSAYYNDSYEVKIIMGKVGAVSKGIGDIHTVIASDEINKFEKL